MPQPLKSSNTNVQENRASPGSTNHNKKSFSFSKPEPSPLIVLKPKPESVTSEKRRKSRSSVGSPPKLNPLTPTASAAAEETTTEVQPQMTEVSLAWKKSVDERMRTFVTKSQIDGDAHPPFTSFRQLPCLFL